MTKALLIIDVQNDFIDGSLAVQDAKQTAHRIGTVLDLNDYDQIVTTQDWHINPGEHFSETPDFKDTWPAHCEAGTHGAELSPGLDPILNRINAQFHKGHYEAAYSGFEGRLAKQEGQASPLNGMPLGKYLSWKGVTDVDIIGIATDYCVKATALDAQKLGYKTRVLLPYTAMVDGTANGTGIQALAEMTEAGVALWPPNWGE